ncbi:hypothetical protein A2397_05605 [Candidatus Amesbacteria bacterium RIFOXYB1_FULL_44_23]|uniref:Uncharacterized protein n=1 Tax=Candidatus Amesbacteria bacterium RIFOXYB1_FULL_44_23 TaxID=1797263 RepID=A0A1F4ZRU7_9BACT|nr:MAG: hypothetical protein A2397_05605 [Candidatus Amesbacteria bacterium RIFOXYB1_FULL_44_23]
MKEKYQSKINIPNNMEIDWANVRWPNFARDDRSADELVLRWLAGEISKNPALLIPKTVGESRRYPSSR